MSLATRSLVLLSFILTSCGSLTVRAPVLELPPIPPRLMEPCSTPPPLSSGTQEALYLQMRQDAILWGLCARKVDLWIELEKYRQAVYDKWKTTSTNTGWKWPWQ